MNSRDAAPQPPAAKQTRAAAACTHVDRRSTASCQLNLPSSRCGATSSLSPSSFSPRVCSRPPAAAPRLWPPPPSQGGLRRPPILRRRHATTTPPHFPLVLPRYVAAPSALHCRACAAASAWLRHGGGEGRNSGRTRFQREWSRGVCGPLPTPSPPPPGSHAKQARCRAPPLAPGAVLTVAPRSRPGGGVRRMAAAATSGSTRGAPMGRWRRGGGGGERTVEVRAAGGGAMGTPFYAGAAAVEEADRQRMRERQTKERTLDESLLICKTRRVPIEMKTCSFFSRVLVQPFAAPTGGASHQLRANSLCLLQRGRHGHRSYHRALI